MNTVSFRTASEAAESWLNTVALVAHFGERGNVDGAYRLLIGYSRALQTDYAEHIDILHGAREALAAQSDAPVEWRGLQSVVAEPEFVYPHVWSSAHEAAVGIARLALDLMVVPLADITDAAKQQATAERLLTTYWRAIAIPISKVAALQERIRRERVKFLALQSDGTASSATTDANGAASVGRENGPVEPDGFFWDGTVHRGMRPKAYLAVRYLWTCRDRSASADDLAEPVWGDRNEDAYILKDALGGTRRDINDFFRKYGIPLHATAVKMRLTLLDGAPPPPKPPAKRGKGKRR